MNRTCVTHTACGHRIDLTDDNRFLDAGTDQPHNCPGPAGPWIVRRHGRHWTIEYALDWDRQQPLYDLEQQAQDEAHRRNAAYERAHAPKPPQPKQAALFDQQEAS